MPNYGNKLTVAAADEPPYLTVGTDVSAKYKGAFCEAKIIDVNKHVKLRVLFDGHPGSYMIDDTELKQGSPLEIGSKIEARHPEKKQQIYINATIQKILDQSRYTVVFDDGDQCILRRNSICLKSGKHFAESETLDQLPLTNPEHFGNPVKVGQASLEQNNHINSTNHSPQQVANNSTTKLSNNITNNNNNSSGGNSGNGKNGYVDFNNQSSSTTDKNGKAHNSVKLDTEKPTKGKSVSSPSNTNSTSTTSSSASGPPGRRGGGKGRKRRESTSASSKQASELDDEPGDDSQDSADIDSSESDVVFASIEIGVKLMVQYGKGKVQNVYEAKVNKIEKNSSGKTRYFVHYTGWNNRYDEWITKSRILSIVSDKDGLAKDTRSKQAEPSPISGNSNQVSSSDVTVKSEPVVSKDKEKDKDVKQPTKAPRRSRHLDAASSPAVASNHISGTEPPSSNATSTANKQGPSPTPSREKDRDRERDKEKEKDIPLKTRRTRLPADNATSASSTDSSASSSEPKVSVKQEDDTKEKEKEREKEKVRDRKETKDKEKEKTKDKESVATPVTRPGRPRLIDAISTAPSAEKAQATSLKDREKEPPTKTRRSRHVDAASSTTTTPANSSASSTASSTPPRSEGSQNDRDKAKDLEKEAHSTKESRSTRHLDSPSQSNQKSNSSSASMKDRDTDKDLSTPAKTRASKQTEAKHTTSASSLASTIVSSSSLSSVSSVSTATTITSSVSTTVSSISTTLSTSTTSDTIPLSTSSVSSKDREKEREKERERDRDRDKEPPTKIRRSRQSTQEAAGNVSNKDTSATNNATTTTITTSTASSTSSTASSSSSYSLALPNQALSALVSFSEREREKFDDALIIDEPDCDKRISILQDKIMTIRHTYMALKAELADLDRRRKRPRMERSSSDHINNFNSSVTCRN